MSEDWKRPEEIAAVFGVSVRRVQQLVQEGIIKSEKITGHAGRMFDLLPTVTDYIKYLSDKAYGKSRSDKELALKEKKLKAEIALKESQGELHRLKTEIASGKYISVEEVQLDYQRFFVQLKKFVLAIPNRVGGMIGGYADPVTVRGVEKDLSKEVNTMLNAFVVAGKQETVEDNIRKSPMRKIKSLKIDKLRSRHPLTAEQLELVRDGCRGYKEKALVEFLVSSGCRVSEVAGLRVDDIDWRDRKCKVIGKGNKERTVYFSVRAKLMLQLYIAERRGGEALFASSRAPYEPLTDRGIEKMISKLGKRIGMERPLYPHLMRHTFASHALNCGMELTIIQHLLGHSDPKTTLIYAEIDPIRVQYEYNRMIC